MSTKAAVQKDAAERVPVQGARKDNLAFIYEGLFTVIVRIQANRQQIVDIEAFRQRIRASLRDIEKQAIGLGYSGADLQETNFAIVALLDEVVLGAGGSVAAQWSQRPLQEELFGNAVAGEVFFEKLDRALRKRDSEETADLLEIYLLCLLLGYRGKYANRSAGELQAISNDLRIRVEHIRGPLMSLDSTAAAPVNSGPPQTSARGVPAWLFYLAAPLAAGCVYVFLKLDLALLVSRLKGLL